MVLGERESAVKATQSDTLPSSAEVRPLAFELAVESDPEKGSRGLISRPTGGGYPPEDDP